MIKELKGLKCCEVNSDLNYLLIPISLFPITPEGARQFNKIYLAVKALKLRNLERTKSGGIKLNRIVRSSWDVKRTRYCIEITVIYEGFAWRIQFRTPTPEHLSGRAAFTKFKRMCLKEGIDLEKYAVENGIEIKKEIEKPLIGAKSKLYYDHVFESVHHIDFHSSYPSGLVRTHPEFYSLINKLYLAREKNEEYKNILNFSIGFMQSIGGCGARYATLARDSINDNNARLRELSDRLEARGRTVIAYNTDGIWYQGKVYHGHGEGDSLGQWHNDHVDCKFRMASAGSYEFIEGGIYYPVVRGVPNELKDDWEWGDIYKDKAQPDLYTFTEERGVEING